MTFDIIVASQMLPQSGHHDLFRLQDGASAPKGPDVCLDVLSRNEESQQQGRFLVMWQGPEERKQARGGFQGAWEQGTGKKDKKGGWAWE